ncbi:MAG TPA: hypothetical protein VFY14_18935 [Streptomyces sp.]|nr:hypothetical protein [Streptomyces sp.]
MTAQPPPNRPSLGQVFATTSGCLLAIPVLVLVVGFFLLFVIFLLWLCWTLHWSIGLLATWIAVLAGYLVFREDPV